MPTFAALSHRQKRVTGLYMGKTIKEATKFFKPEGRTDNREVRELPERPEGWTLNRATDLFFPEYD